MLAQVILDLFNLTPGVITALFVMIGSLFEFFDLYDNLIKFSEAGALLPITSFGHSLADGAYKGALQDGFIGLFSGMFANTQLTELDLANWDVTNIESFAGMFQNSNKLMTVILKAWDTNPNASYIDMFSGCSALTTIYTSSTFEVGNTNTNMFNGCTSLEEFEFNEGVTSIGSRAFYQSGIKNF